MSSALVLGFLHGLGADHLMAIAALSLGTAGDAPAVQRAKALGIAVRFAAGHALLLALGAGALIALGWSLPLFVERGGEMLGGGLLIVMGLVTLQHLRAPRPHQTSRFALRWARSAHEPSRLGPRRTSHAHLPTIIGAAFAISSLRALAMLTPFGGNLAAAPLSQLLALIAVFAAGILGSMLLFGVALAGLLSTRALQRVGHAASALVGLSSIVLGAAWLATA